MATQETYARLRDMTGTSVDDYPDAALDVYLQESLIRDSDGNDPEDAEYTNTYDMHKAAAKIWRDRAASIARFAFDTQIDMTRTERTGVFGNFTKMARYHEMRSVPYVYSAPNDLAEIVEEDNVSSDV